MNYVKYQEVIHSKKKKKIIILMKNFLLSLNNTAYRNQRHPKMHKSHTEQNDTPSAAA